MFLLIVVFLFFCFLMVLGGGGWFWGLLIFLILGFLALLAMWSPSANGTNVATTYEDRDQVEEDLDELDDFMDTGSISFTLEIDSMRASLEKEDHSGIWLLPSLRE